MLDEQIAQSYESGKTQPTLHTSAQQLTQKYNRFVRRSVISSKVFVKQFNWIVNSIKKSPFGRKHKDLI